jgi:phosphoribosyl 1,2-cyclic phosphodiesterase
MKITYYGVRGSVPRPLSGFEIYERIASQTDGKNISLQKLKGLAKKGKLSYGGNTSCVMVNQDDFDIIVDAGSGLRAASMHYLKNNSGPVHILLTHLHWDHIQGIPFFVPLFMMGREIHFHSCIPTAIVKKALHTQGMAPYFPVPFDDLMSKTKFHFYKDDKAFKIGPITVKALEMEHPQATYSYRLSHGKSSYVHMSDTEITNITPKDLTKYKNFMKDSSFVSFDSQFSFTEANNFVTWGHSSAHHFINLFSNNGIKAMSLFHHNPQKSEENIDDLFQRAKDHIKLSHPKSKMKIICAIEGDSHNF